MPEKYLIIPALCSYAYSTHYAQIYASIIRKTLLVRYGVRMRVRGEEEKQTQDSEKMKGGLG